jgi:hypothetical protein
VCTRAACFALGFKVHLELTAAQPLIWRFVCILLYSSLLSYSSPLLRSSLFDAAAPLSQRPHMIRRNPTLIPISDLEVQDIRDAYNKQKAEREKQEEFLRKIKQFSQTPELLKGDPQMLEYLNKVMATKQKEKKLEDKAKRLGLGTGKCPSNNSG